MIWAKKRERKFKPVPTDQIIQKILHDNGMKKLMDDLSKNIKQYVRK